MPSHAFPGLDACGVGLQAQTLLAQLVEDIAGPLRKTLPHGHRHHH